jgi:phage terminase small subunit
MPDRSKKDVKDLLKALSITCEIDDEVYELVSSTSPTIKAFRTGELTFQEALFVENYLSNGFHAGRAAASANYQGLNAGAYGRVGRAVLKKDAVKRIISRRIATKALSADEILADWAEVAKADMTQFMTVQDREVENPDDPANPMVVRTLVPDMAKAEELGVLHLLKKYKLGGDGSISFELRDQDKALDQIARHLGMFEKDNTLQIPKGLVDLLSQTPEERREVLDEYERLAAEDND